MSKYKKHSPLPSSMANSEETSATAVLAEKLTSPMAFVVYATGVIGEVLLRLYNEQTSGKDPLRPYTTYALLALAISVIWSIFTVSRLVALREKRSVKQYELDTLNTPK